MRTLYRGQQIGKVVQVYRKKYVIHTERVEQETADSTPSTGALTLARGLAIDSNCTKTAKRSLSRKPNLTRQERKRANIKMKQLRSRNRVILCMTVIKNCSNGKKIYRGRNVFQQVNG